MRKQKNPKSGQDKAPPARLPNGEQNPEYNQWYYRTHQGELLSKAKSSYQVNRLQKLSYQKEYFEKKKKEILAKDRNRYAGNREARRAQLRDYARTHKEQLRKSQKKYLKTPKGREIYRQGAIKNRDRRRDLTISFYLNTPFEGSQLHHVEEHIGIYLPKEVHRKLAHNVKTGKNMIEVNELAAEWLDQVDKRLSE